jgi:hypothetical protein
MKKVIGYVAVLVGFVLVASSRIPTLFEKLDFLPKIVLDSVLYIGLACFVFGIVVFIMNRNQTEVAGQEVPIYKGKQIVGYRRH